MNEIQKRLYILTAVLAAGFSLIWLIPKSGDMKLSLLKRPLPKSFGAYQGKTTEVTGKELQILAKDTEFERVQYIDLSDRNKPAIEVSIVFSGKDVNNSIHRPERCLRAQGWNFVKEKKVYVKGAMPDGGDMPFREIVCEKPVILNNGRKINVMRVQYYTFFGHTKITEDHYGRTVQDMKDRLFQGYDQQWAYATVSIPVTRVYEEQGLLKPGAKSYSLADSEKILTAFVKELAPYIVEK